MVQPYHGNDDGHIIPAELADDSKSGCNTRSHGEEGCDSKKPGEHTDQRAMIL